MRNLMRALVILIVLSFAFPTKGNEEPVFFYSSTIGGQKYSAGTAWNWVRDTPDWEPGEPLPITIKVAIASAKKELERHVPKEESWQFD
jgi:hypothetical protein